MIGQIEKFYLKTSCRLSAIPHEKSSRFTGLSCV